MLWALLSLSLYYSAALQNEDGLHLRLFVKEQKIKINILLELIFSKDCTSMNMLFFVSWFFCVWNQKWIPYLQIFF